VVPPGNGGGGSSVTPSAKPSVSPAPSPTGRVPVTPSPSPVRSATPLPSPTSAATPDPRSKLRSSWGRIALAQIFDYFPSDGASMSSSQISADASRYDAIWASFDPQPWRSANPQMLVSRYYIPEEDSELISGHDLQWWQQNHPDWILYACDANGNPTQDLAYTPDDGFPDVPLDIHNPAVVQYQLQSLIAYAQANGYNAVAIDQVVFQDIMEGGNPEFGQTVKSGEWGCGVYGRNGAFTKVYQSTTDPQWTADILNWVEQARSATSAAGLALIVNHPIGSITNPNEQTLVRNVDALVDEGGFSDYGNYTSPSDSGVFGATYQYAEWLEGQGVGFIDIDRYALSNETEPTSDQVEWSIATYLMANEGNEELYVNADNTASSGYGTEQYHQEYATPIGQPCSAMYGGSGYDPKNPQIYYRRFTGGMAVVNSGSSAPEEATLPANHAYTDIEGRPVTDPLAIDSADAYVLTTTGNGCS
jgi:hypothetical protein